MMDKRLLSFLGDSKKYIIGNVVFQWISLCMNIVLMMTTANLIQKLYYGTAEASNLITLAVIVVLALIVRFFCVMGENRMTFLSSKAVKKTFRTKIYEKLLRLGANYKEKVSTAEVVQISVEGVDQLETYYGNYLPQFFYSVLAPFTLFIVTAFMSFRSGLILFLLVPMIPMTIVVIQKWAKKRLSKYWDQYTALGDSFLENLQGLTTLKTYEADAYKNVEMNKEAEHFRKITMKVLTMQLNSVTIMDLITYGGAALGAVLAVMQFRAGRTEMWESLAIILLAADYFLPMRRLGSFFHVAMNGMAASDKIFALFELDEEEKGTEPFPAEADISLDGVNFSYEEDREVLHNVSMKVPATGMTAIVGESGCGKSTIAQLLMGRNRNYEGTVTLGDKPLGEIAESELLSNMTYISSSSYLFKGTVRDNLLMGDPTATDEQLWAVLEETKLADFLKTENGLDTALNEQAANLSGGQRQRLALARALLHGGRVYVFDEATSNIDIESENDIMAKVRELSENGSVVLISHRLANVTGADNIYVMDHGNVVEEGRHADLLQKNGTYAALWNAQAALEQFAFGEVSA